MQAAQIEGTEAGGVGPVTELEKEIRDAIGSLDASGFPGGFSTDSPAYEAVVARILRAVSTPATHAYEVETALRAFYEADGERLGWDEWHEDESARVHRDYL